MKKKEVGGRYLNDLNFSVQVSSPIDKTKEFKAPVNVPAPDPSQAPTHFLQNH